MTMINLIPKNKEDKGEENYNNQQDSKLKKPINSGESFNKNKNINNRKKSNERRKTHKTRNLKDKE